MNLVNPFSQSPQGEESVKFLPEVVHGVHGVHHRGTAPIHRTKSTMSSKAYGVEATPAAKAGVQLLPWRRVRGLVRRDQVVDEEAEAHRGDVVGGLLASSQNSARSAKDAAPWSGPDWSP